MRKWFSNEKNLIKGTMVIVVLAMVTIAVGVKLNIKSELQAEEPTSLITLSNGKTAFDPHGAVTTDDVTLDLITQENVFLKIPDNSAYNMAVKDGNVEYVSNTPKGFSEEEMVRFLKGEKDVSSTTEMIPENIVGRQSTLFHLQDGENGFTYINLIANQPLKVIFHHSQREEPVVVAGDDLLGGQRQVLFTFGKSTEDPEKKSNGLPSGILPTDENIKSIDAAYEAIKNRQENKEEEQQEEPEVSYSGFRGAGNGGVNVTKIENDRSQMQTGGYPFDGNDQPGNDSSINNLVVRSFDWVTYNLAFSIQTAPGHEALRNVKYRVKAEYPDAVVEKDGKRTEYLEFLNNVWLGQEDQVNSNNLTASQYDEGTLPMSDAQFRGTVMLYVYYAPNGYQIKPKITLEIVSGVNSRGETVQVGTESSPAVLPSVTVSAKTSIKAIIGTDSKLRVPYDASVGTQGSMAYSQIFAVSMAMVRLSGRNDFKGVSFPRGEVTGTIRSTARFTDDIMGPGGTVLSPAQQEPPQIMSYGVVAGYSYVEKNTDWFTKTPEFNNVNIRSQSVDYKNTDAVFSKLGDQSNAVTDSTGFKAFNTGQNQMSFSFMDPAQYVHPTYWADNTTKIPDDLRFVAAGFGVMKFPYEYIRGKNAAIQTTFVLDSISYMENGRKVTQNNNSQVIMSADNKVTGSILQYSTWQGPRGEVLGSSLKPFAPAGDERKIQGSEVIIKNTLLLESLQNKYAETMTFWNGQTAEFDTTRRINDNTLGDEKYRREKLQYGVLKNGGTYPGTDASSMDNKRNLFNWYDTPEEANRNGTITSIYFKYRKNTVDSYYDLQINIPLILASGVPGNKTKDGNPNVAVSIGRMTDDTGKVLFKYPIPPLTNFEHTQYDANGFVTKNQVPQATFGDTLYVDPMQTRISVRGENRSYSSTQPIKWIVSPKVYVSDNEDYNITITSKLDSNVTYVRGSTKFRDNQSPTYIGDPTIVKNYDGTSTLTWKLVYNKKTSNFDDFEFQSRVDPFKINWQGLLSTQSNNTVVISGVNVQNPAIKDLGPDTLRMGKGEITITKGEEVAISATTDDFAIEVGNNDPSSVGKIDEYGNQILLDDIHYNMYMINGTENAIRNARLLSVLPFNGDGRGTTYNGTLRLLNMKFAGSHGSNARIYYTTSTGIRPGTDPMTINLNGWTQYFSNSRVPVSNIRGIMVVADTLNSNEVISLDYIVEPNNQRAGDVFANSIDMNSNINAPIRSGSEKTVVSDRTLSGKAWLDSDKNGLMDAGEEMLSDVPIRLYRKSIDFNDTTERRLTRDLLGNDITNVTTDSSGNYQFNNLPEGMYRVEFAVGKEYTATIKDATPNSTDPRTSKVRPVNSDGDAITEAYMEPTFRSGMFTSSRFDLANLNGGFLGETKLILYKYIAGLIADEDDDYQPDNQNDLEEDGSLKNKSAALKGAVFELQHVIKEKNTNKILSTKKIGEATTDENGRLDFNLHSLPKDSVNEEHSYQLVEKKSPIGYELLKSPIELKPTWGQDMTIYVGNAPQTTLPYTGTNKIMQGMIIMAGFTLLMGLFFICIKLFKWEDNWQ